MNWKKTTAYMCCMLSVFLLRGGNGLAEAEDMISAPDTRDSLQMNEIISPENVESEVQERDAEKHSLMQTESVNEVLNIESHSVLLAQLSKVREERIQELYQLPYQYIGKWQSGDMLYRMFIGQDSHRHEFGMGLSGKKFEISEDLTVYMDCKIFSISRVDIFDTNWFMEFNHENPQFDGIVLAMLFQDETDEDFFWICFSNDGMYLLSYAEGFHAVAPDEKRNDDPSSQTEAIENQALYDMIKEMYAKRFYPEEKQLDMLFGDWDGYKLNLEKGEIWLEGECHASVGIGEDNCLILTMGENVTRGFIKDVFIFLKHNESSINKIRDFIDESSLEAIKGFLPYRDAMFILMEIDGKDALVYLCIPHQTRGKEWSLGLWLNNELYSLSRQDTSMVDGKAPVDNG